MELRFIVQLAIIGFTFFMLINASALLVLAERKIMGFMQQRYGPYLVGPHGLLQPLADILKLLDRKSTRLNSSHLVISYAVFCLKKKNNLISLIRQTTTCNDRTTDAETR